MFPFTLSERTSYKCDGPKSLEFWDEGNLKLGFDKWGWRLALDGKKEMFLCEMCGRYGEDESYLIEYTKKSRQIRQQKSET